MNRYNSYKDSGVEWIGEIPKHWSFSKMKYVLSNNDGGVWGNDTINEDDGIIVIRSTEITIDGKWDLSNPIKRVLTENEFLKSKLYEGDIVITKSSGSPQHIGKSVLVDRNIELLNCCYSNFVQRIRFRNFIPKLYHYILNSDIARSQFKFLTTSSTGLGNLNGSSLNDILLPLIPNLEQEQIVAYLDKKTAIVDTLIASKEEKINLLKEKRTALINHVITKGLDPNVKLKDSGIEWIGEIPAHWIVSTLRYYVEKVGSGSTPRGGSEVYVDEGIIFLRSQNIHFEGLKIEDVSRIEESIHNQMNGSKVQFEDVLLNITGGSIGRCCVSNLNEEMNVNQHVSIIRTKKQNLNPYFLNYQLKSDLGFTQVDYFQTGGNREGLTIDNIKNFIIPFPKIDEQLKIVDYLDTHTKEINELISLEYKKIETLKEYRQALISEVVTGKIKVVK